MNRLIVIAMTMIFPAAIYAEETSPIIQAATKWLPQLQWNAKSIVKADINCDGKIDFALIGKDDKTVWIAVFAEGLDTKPKTLSFAKEMMCSTHYQMRLERQDYPKAEMESMLGEIPEGFQFSKQCKGLNLNHGECDSMHIYWNHLTKDLDVWSL